MQMITDIMEDKTNIDNLTRSFFSLFNNKKGNQTDWNSIHELCIPEAIIIKKEGHNETLYTLTGFIDPRKKILTDGTLTGFEEFEIEEHKRVEGCIAQRYSRYQKNGKLNGQYFDACGTKFFQFIKTKHGWKISSVVWEDALT